MLSGSKIEGFRLNGSDIDHMQLTHEPPSDLGLEHTSVEALVSFSSQPEFLENIDHAFSFNLTVC